MNAERYFLFAALMVGGLMLSASPVAAWSDNNAHSATSTACTTHVNTPVQTIPSTYTFNLCVANSQATQWKAVILDRFNNTIPTCLGFGWTTNLNPWTKTCSNLPQGSIKVNITWKIGSSNEMSFPDNFYRP